MTGGVYDIIAEEAATLILQFEYQDETGSAVNITSSSNIIEFLVKKTSTQTDSFMFKMRSDGNDEEGTVSFPNTHSVFGTITKTGGTVGSFLLTVNADTMESLKLGNYFYSLRLLNNSTVTPLCKGRISVESKVK
jgi:hypothetical protein